MFDVVGVVPGTTGVLLGSRYQSTWPQVLESVSG